MQAERLGSGPWPELDINGDILTIDGKSHDLNARRADSENLVEIRSDGFFLAHVVLPPNKYENSISGEGDEQTTIKSLLPLQTDEVRIVLWSIPEAGDTNAEEI